MTIKQEEIAEKIIQLHKENNEQFNWDEFFKHFPNAQVDSTLIRRTLLSKELIEKNTQSTTVLTSKGRSFTSFELERKKILEKEQQETEKEKYILLQSKFIYKSRYFPYLISVAAFILSALSFFKPFDFQNDINKTQDLNKDSVKTEIKKDTITNKDTIKNPNFLKIKP